MELPRSTEALTKLLRSKEITTGQIYDIVRQFDHLDLYFPNRENFILELLIDRWNDQKLVEFKKDHKMWELFNDMWIGLGDDVILKKMFKRLRFVPHLIKSLELVDIDVIEFLKALKQTCSLINSIVTVDVSVENANSILGKAVKLVSQMEVDCTFRSQFLEEIQILADLRNIPEVSTKLSNSYCDEVLLPSLKYTCKFENETYDPTIESLAKLLEFFVFSPAVDTVKLLTKFADTYGNELRVDDTLILFKKSISFMSKENFLQLEKVFTIMTKLHPELSPTLLKELSLSKKTMSREFLDNLFDEALIAFKGQQDPSNLWQMIFHILDLDIEVGIDNNDRLLDLITGEKDRNFEWTVKLWTKLISCHSDARELPQFLEKLEVYCRENGKSSHFLLTDKDFTEAVSTRSASFSISQYKTAVSKLLDELEADSEDLISLFLLKMLLQGLTKLPNASVNDVKGPLKTVFKLKGGKNQSQFWQIRYLIMEVFDDILPDEILGSSENEIQTSIVYNESPMDLLYYFFKLREYKVFDLTPIVNVFMGNVRQLAPEQQSQVLANVFTNWSTIINSLFPSNEIQYLAELLCTNRNIHILENLFNDDDIFEESNVMRFIVSRLFNSYNDEKVARLILTIPIQCINKTIRVELINGISDKAPLTDLDLSVMVHLLENPTFKSDIESNWKSLASFMDRNMLEFTYEQPVFETIWNNHLSQRKEAVSQEFLKDGIASLSAKLEKNGLDLAIMKMAFLVIKIGGKGENKDLRNKYSQRVLELIVGEYVDTKDVKISSWLLRTLYYVIDRDQIDSPKVTAILSAFIKDLGSAIREADQDLLASVFLLFSALYDDKLEYIFAHYMVLREASVDAILLKPGLEAVIRRSLEGGTEDFNHALYLTISSFELCTPVYAEGLLELYQVQLEHLGRDNVVGSRLFVKSLSAFYTNSSKFECARNSILQTLQCINGLLTSKSWIFSQYCVEMLFPMCLKLSLNSIRAAEGSDEFFISTTKLISNILFNHRMKLSNRHHLVIALISEYLELLSNHEVTKLSSSSSRSLSRLIINFCEPVSGPVKGKNTLNSKVSMLKSSLRKHVPILLIKYVHLSISSPFEPSSRTELTTAMYSIFDLLSQNELGLVNAALDNAGRQYLKGLYADYRKTGRWHAD